MGVSDEDYGNYPVEFLHSLHMPGLPPHELRLAKRVIIILLRNIDVERGLCNRIRAFVVHCRRRLVDILVITGLGKGRRFLIPRIPMTSEAHALPFKLQRRQFPTTTTNRVGGVGEVCMVHDNQQGSGTVLTTSCRRSPQTCLRTRTIVRGSRSGVANNIKVSVHNTEKQGLS